MDTCSVTPLLSDSQLQKPPEIGGGVSFVKVIVLQNTSFFPKCISVEMDTCSVTPLLSDSQLQKPPEIGGGVSFVKVIVLQHSSLKKIFK